MIRLDLPTRSLRAVLSGAITTSQLQVFVSYTDKLARDGTTSAHLLGATVITATNSTTVVEVCPATSQSGAVRDIDYISVRNRDTAAAIISFGFLEAGTDYIIISCVLAVNDLLTYSHKTGWMVHDVNGALKQTFAQSSTLDVTTLLNLTGGQIQFPATQVSSSGVNVLDDYEEGTFSAGLSFATPGDSNIVLSGNTCTYTKIGRMVHITLSISTSTFTHTTAAGNFQITGLPFTSGTVSQCMGALQWGGITKANYTNAVLQLGSAATLLTIAISGSGQTQATITTADMPTGGSVIIRGQISYPANA